MGHAVIMDRGHGVSIDDEQRIGNPRPGKKKPRRGSPSRAVFSAQGREILSTLLDVSTVS